MGRASTDTAKHPAQDSAENLAEDPAEDRGAKQGAWMEMIRRSRIGRDRKAAMLVIGSYAGADGTGVFPGVARLAVDCEVSYRTAGRYLKWARDVGLIELVKKGNRRRRLADEYRLIIGPDLRDRVTIPHPGVYRKLIEDIAAANRAESARRQRPARTEDHAGNHATGDRHDADQHGDQHVGEHIGEPSSTDTSGDRRNDEGQRPGSADLRTQGGRRNPPARNGSPTDTKTSVGTRFYGHQDTVSTDTPDVRPPTRDHLTSSTDLPTPPTDRRYARYPSARASGSNAEKQASTRRRIHPAERTCRACGVVLDPDGSCFMCGTSPQPGTSPAA